LTEGRNDLLLEELVSKLKLTAKVSKVSWEFVSQEAE